MINRFIKAILYIFVLAFILQGSGVYAAHVHRVQEGETLAIIAQNYGVAINEIVDKNNLINPHTIFPQQVLIIPENKNETVDIRGGSTYTVAAGDSLFKISAKIGVSMAALAEQNSLNNMDLLYVGQVLQLPALEAKEKPTPKPQPQPQPVPEHQYSISQLVKMYSDTLYLKGSADERKVALTFDDGPDDKYTEQVLDVLREYNVPGTFFLLGNRVVEHTEVVDRIYREGHVIGNHSWSHPNLSKESEGRIYNEMVLTDMIIESVIGKKPALVRPPYGAVTKENVEQLRDMNYKIINWNVDSVDWRDRDVDQILINTLPDVKPGSIILFHSAGGESRAATVDALKEIIYTLRVQGYEFVTVDQLLSVPAYQN